MALWLGSLQLMLDKGQESDWFGAAWIRWTLIISVAAFFGFFIREMRCRDPIVQLHVLGNRNFVVGTIITTIFGFVLYGVTALLPLFLQTLLGYPALDSGLAVSPRGLGSMLAMLVAGGIAATARRPRDAGRRPRHLRHLHAHARPRQPRNRHGLGRRPLHHQRIRRRLHLCSAHHHGHGTPAPRGDRQRVGIYNLMRNIGGSIGIATATTVLVRRSQVHQNYLVAHLTAGAPPTSAAVAGLAAKLSASGFDSWTAHHMALGAILRMATQQAALLAYVDNFNLMGWLALIAAPLVFFFQRVGKR